MAIRYGMGPGQSRAMAGNTGLASFTEKDINRVQQAKRDFNEFSGRNRDERASYTDIGQEIGELGSKYRRPVKIADGLGAYSDGSGRAYTPNDFNSDGSFRSFTASRPTFGQMMGDAGRAFTGYNSIKYDKPSGLFDSTLTGSTDQFGRPIGQSYSPISMQRTPGMMDVGGGIMSMLANMAVPGAGTLMNLYRGARNRMQDTGNNMQGGMQKLIDYRPQMNRPREGVMGGIDQLFNIGKGMIGGVPYSPMVEEETVTTDYVDPMVLNALINRAR
tara:strand:- start:2559 stop:3380 length:822 start_codon:yes stop_codon:yes gene_type:complete